MKLKRPCSESDAKRVGEALGVNWASIDIEQFRMGLEIELEHGTMSPETNITNDEDLVTGKIVHAHLRKFPDYYTLLKEMEMEAERDLASD